MSRLQTVNKIISFYKKWQDFLPYFFVAFLVAGPWFFQSGYLFFVDTVWGPNTPLNFMDNWFLFNSLAKLIAFVLPWPLVQKLFILMVVFTALFGGKKIAEQFIDSRVFVFVVSLFSFFNPFVYDRFVYGQMGVILGQGLIMAFVGYLLAFLKNRDTKDFVKSAIALGLAAQFLVHTLILVVPLIFVLIWIFWEKKSYFGVKKITLFVSIVLFLNIHWLSGYLLGDSLIKQSIDYKINREDLVTFQPAGNSTLAVIKDQFFLLGFWASNSKGYQNLKLNDRWWVAVSITLMVIFFGFYHGLKSKKWSRFTCGFGLLFLVSFFLALGLWAPGSKQLTGWLFDNFSFYRGFRETQKWLVLVVLVYGIFLSLGISKLLEYKFLQNRKNVLAGFFVVVFVFQAPQLLFGLKQQIKVVDYPVSWYQVDRYLVKNQVCGKNIIFLPWHGYMSFNFIGRVVANPADVFFQCSVFRSHDPGLDGEYGGREDAFRQSIYNWAESGNNNSSEIDNPLAIDYIILAKELDWENYLWLDDSDKFDLIIDNKDLRLYKNL